MNWQNLWQGLLKLRNPLDNRLATLTVGGIFLGVALGALAIRMTM